MNDTPAGLNEPLQVIYNPIINDNKPIILRVKAHLFRLSQALNPHQKVRAQWFSAGLLHLQREARGEEVKHKKIILPQHLQRKLSARRKAFLQ